MRKTAFGLGKRLLATSICVLLVALTACGGPSTPPASSPPASAKPPATSAAPPATSAAPAASYPPYTPKPPEPATPTGPPLKGLPKAGDIIAPKPGVWASSSVYCQVEVSNMYIVARSDKNVEGQGHVDFYLDMTPPTTAGVKAGVLPSPAPTGAKVFIADAQAYIVFTGATYTFTGVSNGNHTFAAQVVQNDDTPFNPPIIWAPVQFTVAKPAATPALSPSASPK